MRRRTVNLTQHSYFNLRGDGDVLAYRLTIDAGTYLARGRQSRSHGERRPVSNTPFDFREPCAIGARIGSDDEQLRMPGGYDHAFVLNRGEADLALAARISDPSSGRALEVSTTEPGLQLLFGPGGGVSRSVPGAAALSGFAESARVSLYASCGRASATGRSRDTLSAPDHADRLNP